MQLPLRRPFPYLRPGVGIIPYRESTKEIIIFERLTMPGVWQFPQGGLDLNESPSDALWRELWEETGITKEQTVAVTEFPNWTTYTYTDAIRRTLPHPECIGQCHRWFFVAVLPQVTINLATKSDQEFSAWQLSTFADLLPKTAPLKLPIYQELAIWYRDHLT